MELKKESKEYLNTIKTVIKNYFSDLFFENDEYKLYRVGDKARELDEIDHVWWLADLLEIDIDSSNAFYLKDAILELDNTGLKEEDLKDLVEEKEIFYCHTFCHEYFMEYCRIDNLHFINFHGSEIVLYDFILVEKKVENPDYTEVLFQMFDEIFKSRKRTPINEYHEITIDGKFISKQKLMNEYPSYPQEYIFN